MSYAIDDFARDMDVSRETLDKLELYAALLKKWQPAKNLVSNSTLDDMWRRHFLDSAQVLPHIRATHGDRALSCLDIGSGAGFPGLVLSIMGVGSMTMVEANHKKCAFMRQVSRETGADAVIENDRIESLAPREVDIILSRACASVTQLLTWGHPFCGQTTEFWLLKGANVDKELTEAQKTWNMTVEQIPSVSDPEGCLLRLSAITLR